MLTVAEAHELSEESADQIYPAALSLLEQRIKKAAKRGLYEVQDVLNPSPDIQCRILEELDSLGYTRRWVGEETILIQWSDPQSDAYDKHKDRSEDDETGKDPKEKAREQTCPVCNGDGYEVFPEHSPQCTSEGCAPDCPIPARVPCPACGGAGFVEVEDESEGSSSKYKWTISSDSTISQAGRVIKKIPAGEYTTEELQEMIGEYLSVCEVRS